MRTIIRPSALPVDVFSAAAGQAAWSTFSNIAAEWDLSTAERITLLGLGQARFDELQNGPVGSLERDLIERLSYLFGIYKALQLLFPTTDQVACWLRAPNSAPLFNDQSALDRMLRGQVADLAVVRRYLDSVTMGKA